MANYRRPPSNLIRLMDAEETLDSLVLEQEIDKLVERQLQGPGPPRLFDVPVQIPPIRRSVMTRALQNIYSSTPMVPRKRPNRFTEEISSISSFNGTDNDESKKKPSKVAKKSIGEVIVINSSTSQGEAVSPKKSLQQQTEVSRYPHDELPSTASCPPGLSENGDKENTHNQENSPKGSKTSNHVSQNASRTSKPALNEILKTKVLQQQKRIETKTLIVPQTNQMITRSRSLDKSGLKVDVEDKQSKRVSSEKRTKDQKSVRMEELLGLRINLVKLAEADSATIKEPELPPGVANGSEISLRSQDHRLEVENDLQINRNSSKGCVNEAGEKESISVERGRRKRKAEARVSMPRSKSDHRPDVGSKGHADEKFIVTRERSYESKRDLDQDMPQVDRNQNDPRMHNGKASSTIREPHEASTNEDDASHVHEKQRSENKATMKTSSYEREVSPNVEVDSRSCEGTPKTSDQADCGDLNQQMQEERETATVQRNTRLSHKSIPANWSNQAADELNAKLAHETSRKTSPVRRSVEESGTLARGDPGSEKKTPAGVTPEKRSSLLNRGTPKTRKSVTFVNSASPNTSPQNEEGLEIAKSPNVTYDKSNLGAGGDHDYTEPTRTELQENRDEVDEPLPPSNKKLLGSRPRILDSDSELETEPRRKRDDARCNACDCKSKRKGKRWTIEEKARKRHHCMDSEDEDVDSDHIWRKSTRRYRKESRSDSSEEHRKVVKGKRKHISKYANWGDSMESDVDDPKQRKHETVKSKRKERHQRTETRRGARRGYESESDHENEEKYRKRAKILQKQIYDYDDQSYDSDSEPDLRRPTQTIPKQRIEKDVIKSKKKAPYEEKKNKRFEKHYEGHRHGSDFNEEDHGQPQMRIDNKDLRQRKNGQLKSLRVADKKEQRWKRRREHYHSYSSESGEEVRKLNVDMKKRRATEQKHGGERNRDTVYDENRMLIKYRDNEDDITTCDEDHVHQQHQKQRATVNVEKLKKMVDAATSPLNCDPNVAIRHAVDVATSPLNLDANVATSHAVDVATSPLDLDANLATSQPVCGMGQTATPRDKDEDRQVGGADGVIEGGMGAEITTRETSWSSKKERLHRLTNYLMERKSCSGSSSSNGVQSDLQRLSKRLSVSMFKRRQVAPAVEAELLQREWSLQQQPERSNDDDDKDYSSERSSTNSRLIELCCSRNEEDKREHAKRGSPRLFETVADTEQFWVDSNWGSDENTLMDGNDDGRWRGDDLPQPPDNYRISLGGAGLKMGFPCRSEADILKDSRGRVLSPTDSDEESWTFAELPKKVVAPKKISLTPVKPPTEKSDKKSSKLYYKKKILVGAKNTVNALSKKSQQVPSTSERDHHITLLSSPAKKNRSHSDEPNKNVSAQSPRSSKRSSSSKLSRTRSQQQAQEAEEHQKSESPLKMCANRSRNHQDKGPRHPSNSLNINRTQHENKPDHRQRSSTSKNRSRENHLEDQLFTSPEHVRVIDEGEVTLSRTRTLNNRSVRSRQGEEDDELLSRPRSSRNRSVKTNERQDEVEDFSKSQTNAAQSKTPSRDSCGKQGKRGDFVKSGNKGKKKTVAPHLLDTLTSKHYNDRCVESNCQQQLSPAVTSPDKTRPVSISRQLTPPEHEARAAVSLPAIAETDEQHTADYGDTGVETQEASSSKKAGNRPKGSRTSTRNKRTEQSSQSKRRTRSSFITPDNIISSDAAENIGVRRSYRERRPPKPQMYQCIVLVNTERQLKCINKDLPRVMDENDVSTVVASLSGSRISRTGKRPSVVRTSVSTSKRMTLLPPGDPCSSQRWTKKHAPNSIVTEGDNEKRKITKRKEKARPSSNNKSEAHGQEEHFVAPLQDTTFDSGMEENVTTSMASSVCPRQEASTSRGKKTQKRHTTTAKSTNRSRSKSKENSDGALIDNCHQTDGGPFEKLSKITYGPLNDMNKDLLTGASDLFENFNQILLLPGGVKPLHFPRHGDLGFIVMDGNALVRIGRSYSLVGKEERFKVRKGEMYMIKNMSEVEPLKLLCMKA